MDFDRLGNDLSDLRRRNRALAGAATALILALLLALLLLLRLAGTERTVIVPPSINKSFWVTRDKASNEYLEQMGSFVAWLVLDVTTASIDWKKDILLGYAQPDFHGELKVRQEVEATRLKRINASTSFLPQQLVASEDSQSLVIHGRLRTLVNNLETANELKSYRVEFDYAGGRMHLRAFRDVTQDTKKEAPNARP
jgi:conjugal transfer pilus assembly protein TraE